MIAKRYGMLRLVCFWGACVARSNATVMLEQRDWMREFGDLSCSIEEWAAITRPNGDAVSGRPKSDDSVADPKRRWERAATIPAAALLAGSWNRDTWSDNGFRSETVAPVFSQAWAPNAVISWLPSLSQMQSGVVRRNAAAFREWAEWSAPGGAESIFLARLAATPWIDPEDDRTPPRFCHAGWTISPGDIRGSRSPLHLWQALLYAMRLFANEE